MTVLHEIPTITERDAALRERAAYVRCATDYANSKVRADHVTWGLAWFSPPDASTRAAELYPFPGTRYEDGEGPE